MKQVNIHEAKTHLSRLVQDVLNGEEVVIAKDSKPLIRLVIHESALPKRTPGKLPGLILSMAEDFDDPLDDFEEYMS